MRLTRVQASRSIQPGKPWRIGYIETFFGEHRDELLSFELFEKGPELQSALESVQDHYNNHRPLPGLVSLTPACFIEGLQETLTREGNLVL